MSQKPTRVDLLSLDIDLRLTALWRQATSVSDEEWTLDLVGPFMRAAYGQGYMDALAEQTEGQLCRDHGYSLPKKRPA